MKPISCKSEKNIQRIMFSHTDDNKLNFEVSKPCAIKKVLMQESWLLHHQYFRRHVPFILCVTDQQTDD